MALEALKQQGEPSHTNLWGVAGGPSTERSPIPSDVPGVDTYCHNHPSWEWSLGRKDLGNVWFPGTDYNTKPLIWGSAPVSKVR